MADWHLRALEQALVQRGWRVERVADSTYPLADGLWRIHRGADERWLELAWLDGDGRCLQSAEQSYGGSVRGRPELGLYFFRRGSPRWAPALRDFVRGLDGLCRRR